MKCIYRELFKRVGIFSRSSYEELKKIKKPSKQILKLIKQYEKTSKFVDKHIADDESCSALKQ